MQAYFTDKSSGFNLSVQLLGILYGINFTVLQLVAEP